MRIGYADKVVVIDIKHQAYCPGDERREQHETDWVLEIIIFVVGCAEVGCGKSTGERECTWSIVGWLPGSTGSRWRGSLGLAAWSTTIAILEYYY